MTLLEKRILEQFKALLRERLQVHKVILFGSRARGDADPQSDMDVVVILEGPARSDVQDCVSDCAWEAGFGNGIVLVPVVFAREEWESGPERHSLFVQAVEAEGVPL